MITDRRKVYDAFLYHFEYWYGSQFTKWAILKYIWHQKVDPKFYEDYRKVIRPYWKKLGARPRRYLFKYLYMLTGSTDPRYIPHVYFSQFVVPHFDEPMYIRQLADKNLASLLFWDVKRPETVFKRLDGSFANDDLNPIPREEALRRLDAEGDYVIKPTRDSGQGTDVRFFHTMPRADVEELLAKYEGKTDYIVQKAVVQHPVLSNMNASSLNTIRVVTLVFHDEVHVLSTILRVGGSGSKVDNVSKGGYQCTIQPDGRLEPLAWTSRSGRGQMVEENENGLRFADVTVPSFDRVLSTVRKLALRMPHLKLIGWDIAVDEAGDPVLVEFNSQISQNQATCGPTFGDLTEEVLTEVFKKKKKN